MSEISCKRCGASDPVKNGIVRGLQRYLCQPCGCNFTMTPPRGKPAAMKALAVLLYAMGNVSFGSIARLLGVSDVAVLNWVRDEARSLAEPSTKADVVVVTLDEMWHLVKERLQNYGFGEPMTLLLGEPSPGFLVAVMTPHAKSSSTKSAVPGKTFVTDDWAGYHRLIPEDQLFTGKDLTVSIEQDNSNIRHYVARFRRRTKVVSKVEEMVDLSLRVYHRFHDNIDAFIEKASIFRSIFS